MFPLYKKITCEKCGTTRTATLGMGWTFKDENGEFDFYKDRCECGHINHQDRVEKAEQISFWIS